MYKMIVDFETYFEDEMICCDDVDEILANYGWEKEVRCSCCGKVISIFDAMFNRERDYALCADCAEEEEPML